MLLNSTQLVTLMFLLSTAFSTSVAWSQDSSSKIKMETNKVLRIVYSNKRLNSDPNKSETLTFALKDAESGRVVAIQVEENGANSGIFTGTYAIAWKDTPEVLAEIYFPPQKNIKLEDPTKEFAELIREGRLLRKPYFIKVEKSGQTIQVYDSKTQALAAFAEYRKTGSGGKDIVDKAAIEAQRIAEIEAERNRLAAIAAQQEAERAKLAEAERLRKEELKRKAQAMKEEERKKLIAQAKMLAAEGLQLYRIEKFKEAQAKFEEAVELHPENKTFYYQYGVTLYKLEKFNKSLVVLEATKLDGAEDLERSYYLALNHMRLKEYDRAYANFGTVKNNGSKNLTASSAFFMGVMDFQEEKYDRSKGLFEFVLDNSEDPNLDNQAEAYIEQIANIMAFEEERKKKFLFTANLGLALDSNILTVSNSQIDAGVPSDLDGFRWSYGASAEYRPIYGPIHEFSSKLSFSDIYSTDKKLAANASFQSTDPLSVSLNLPYKYKGRIFGKGYQLGLTPLYETVIMNVDGTGSRETILNSAAFKVDQTFIIDNDWFSSVGLEARSDVSLISTTGDDDQTANKYTISTSNIFFQDKKKTEAWIAEVGVTLNQAKGANQTYNRVDLGGSYMTPFKWDSSLTTRIGFYSASYGSHTTGRSDNNVNISSNLRKPLKDNLSLTAGFSYILNKSSLASSDYNKYTISTGITWDGFL